MANFWKINEDGKSELYFDYATFKALPETDKKEIKAYYLWSRGKSAWVSKVANNTSRTESIAKRTNLSFMGASKKESKFSYRTQGWIKQMFDLIGKEELENMGEPKNWDINDIQDVYIDQEGVDYLSRDETPVKDDDFYNEYWQTVRKDLQTAYDSYIINTNNVPERDKKEILYSLNNILKIVKGETFYSKTLIVDAFMRKLVKMPLVSRVFAIQTAIDLQEKNKITIFNSIHKFWKIVAESEKPKDNIRDHKENSIVGGLADGKNIIDIAKKHAKDEGWMREQLETGINVEFEHTNDREKATEIALDHLFESPIYYIELAKMEKKIKQEDVSTNAEFEVGDYVYYEFGDVPVRKAYGVIKKVIPLGKEFAYRIDAYVMTDDGLMFESEKTNEKYEVQLHKSFSTQTKFEELERQYNSEHNSIVSELNDIKNENSATTDIEDGFSAKIKEMYSKKQVKSTKEQVLDVLKRADLDWGHIKILQNWEGEGSVKDGDSKTGILHEFFTPYWLCQSIGEIVKSLGIDNPKVLDPAIGTSRLIDNIKYKQYVGFEVNPFNFEISKKLHYGSNVNLYNQAFETAFLKAPRFNSLAKDSWIGNDYDLVVSNPPYGEYRGEYKTYMPKVFNRFEFLFVYLTMTLVKKGGYGIFVLPQSFMNNGNMYNTQKEKIMSICEFVDAVRLPNGIFATTEIGVDLLILRKK